MSAFVAVGEAIGAGGLPPGIAAAPAAGGGAFPAGFVATGAAAGPAAFGEGTTGSGLPPGTAGALGAATAAGGVGKGFPPGTTGAAGFATFAGGATAPWGFGPAAGRAAAGGLPAAGGTGSGFERLARSSRSGVSSDSLATQARAPSLAARRQVCLGRRRGRPRAGLAAAPAHRGERLHDSRVGGRCGAGDSGHRRGAAPQV